MALNLPRLQRGFPIAADGGTPSDLFHQNWQQAMEQIENAINNINTIQEGLVTLEDDFQDMSYQIWREFYLSHI